MIQRIQTLYLLAITILMALVTFMQPINFAGNSTNYTLAFSGVLNTATNELVFSTIPLTILSVFTALIALITVFLFKKRMLQIRLSVFNTVLLVGYIPMMFYYINLINKQLDVSASYKVMVVFPVIGAILSILAIRAIGKDEATIRSLNRIR